MKFTLSNSCHRSPLIPFLNRVKHEAKGCDFTCDSGSCNVKDTLIRDQVIIGTCNKEFTKNALHHQWNLSDLTTKGRQLEVATHGTDVIAAAGTTMDTSYDTNVDHIHHPGKFSKEKKAHNRMSSSAPASTHAKCTTCSSSHCKSGWACPA